MEFTLRPLRKIFLRAGAKRVSNSAAEELGLALEKRSKELIEEAQRLALHAKRHTVMSKDIKMARKTLKR